MRFLFLFLFLAGCASSEAVRQEHELNIKSNCYAIAYSIWGPIGEMQRLQAEYNACLMRHGLFL
jgi:hypothetical protein